jgi:hypothetical protein
MTDNDKTVNRWLPAALCLVMGGTVRDAAAASNVAEVTVYRWRKKKRFAAKVRQLRQEVIDTALGKLLSSLSAACDTLTELLGPSHHENTRLRAAVALLEQASRYHNDAVVSARLAELEQQVAEQQVGA